MELHAIKPVTGPDQLSALGEELGIGADWTGEPDLDRIGADVDGDHLTDDGYGYDMFVTLWKDGTAVASVNLLSLFAWAAAAQEAGIRADERRKCAQELRDYAAGLTKEAMPLIIDGDEANGLPKISRAAAIDSAAKLLDGED